MSNMEFYSESLDDGTLTYSATEDTNYPVENIQDRNINTFFKDSAIGAATVNIVIDLGAARSCNSIVLGNYIATAANAARLKLECHSADAWVGAQTEAFAETEIEASALTDKVITFSAQSFRYWRMVFDDEAAGNLTDLQFGCVFLGTEWNWAHEPELRKPDESGYNVTVNEADEARYGQTAGVTARRIWGVPYDWIESAEKTKIETFRDNIFMDNRNGLSRYPFYFTDDGGTTFYFARARGKLSLVQRAYQVWRTNFIFEEEL
jgi:hypothetical protein